MIKKVSIVALCALALLSGKVLAEEKPAEEQAQQQQEATPVKEGEEKPAGGAFEDVLESPKIKELLNQENIDWDAVMKVLGDMNFNLGAEEGAAEESNHEHHEHSHSHSHGDTNGDSFDVDEEL